MEAPQIFPLPPDRSPLIPESCSVSVAVAEAVLIYPALPQYLAILSALVPGYPALVLAGYVANFPDPDIQVFVWILPPYNQPHALLGQYS